MKKISLFMLSLFVAATMSATVVTMDFTSATDLLAMGIDSIPAAGKDWTLTGKSLAKDGVTLTGVKVAKTDNRIFAAQKDGALTLRSYYSKDKTSGVESKNTLTFTVASPDVIKGLVFDGTAYFDGVEMNKIVTNAASVTLSCNTNATVKSVKVYVNEDVPTYTVDTISVSEARARIDKSEKQACYIKGVVISAPFTVTYQSQLRYCVWLTDIDSPSDSIEAFSMRPGQATTTGYTSVDEMAKDFGLLDTVLIKADGLDFFKPNIYETTAGYFVETLGKSPKTNGNEIFKYGVGAVQCGMAYDGVRYKYEVVLSKVDEEDFDNAVHMVINSAKEKGIAGKYTIKNYQNDTSYVNREDGGKDLIEGSLQLTYLEPDGMYSKYTVKATFMLGGVSCIIDTTYILPGWTSDHDPFLLKDDVPYKPKPGDTLTCAQAASYAASLGSSTGDTVYVRGFVTGFQKSDYDRRAQQSPYMADDKTATKGVFQAYMGYTQNRDSIVTGDEIIVYGPVSYFAKSSMGQIKNGQIYRVGGSNTQRPVETEEVPADAISVADAIAMGAKLAERDTTEEVTVKGYVTKLYKTFNGMYSSQSFYMDDQPFEEGKFYTMEAFQSQIAVAAVVGDYVFVKGRITKYEPTSSSAARRDAAEVSYNIVNSVTKFAELTTGLEQVKQVATKSGARKVMMNGQMFILKDGVLYNALGAQVQ